MWRGRLLSFTDFYLLLMQKSFLLCVVLCVAASVIIEVTFCFLPEWVDSSWWKALFVWWDGNWSQASHVCECFGWGQAWYSFYGDSVCERLQIDHIHWSWWSYLGSWVGNWSAASSNLQSMQPCLWPNSRTPFSRFRIFRSMRSVLITTKLGTPTRPSSSISALMKEKRVRIPFLVIYRLEDGLDTIGDELLKDEDVETGFAWHR